MIAVPPDSKPIRVMLVDDHPIVRDGYRHLLDSTPDLRVVAEAGDGKTAGELYAKVRPDVVILDLSMPGISGLDTLRLLKSRDAAARILVFTMHHSAILARRVLEAGAVGYLTKSGDVAQMLDAVRKVAENQPYIDANYVTTLAYAQAGSVPQHKLKTLSVREFQIFRRLAEGQSTIEIAAALAISPKTAGVHRARILKKLDCRNVAQLALLAVQAEVIEP